jgi:CheY-like chemotaxis protein
MVFLVDDDSDDIEIVQEALYRNNYHGEIGFASNGQVLMDQLSSVAAAEKKKPDLILLDPNMPLKNGFEVLSELKNDPLLKSIPVMILTASSNKQDEIRCFELGCNMFWNKPSTLAEYNTLVNVIINFLEEKRA